MKDLVLLAASFYLLKQDVLRAVSAPEYTGPARRANYQRNIEADGVVGICGHQ
jgi:hypothetical protein